MKTTLRLLGKSRPVLVRTDSAFYGRGAVHAPVSGGAAVSVIVRMDPAARKSITTIPKDAWTKIEYTNAVFAQTTGRWISRAEVAEVGFTAFTSAKESQRS